MIQRLSIILLILVALATPAAAGTAAFSLFVYFENFSDQPATFTKTDSASSLDTASDKCPNLKIKYKDGSIAGDIINAASKATGVEAAQIAAQIEIESGFSQSIFSKDSTASEGQDDPIAYGLMQTTAPTYNSKTKDKNLQVTYRTKIKPLPNGSTYELYIVTGKNYILDNPAAAVLAGAWYYRDQLDMFDHNPDIAVAAYNAGPQHIFDRGWKKGKPMPKLFDETMEHVKKFDIALAKYRGCQKAATQSSPGKVILNIPVYSQGPRTCAGTSVDMVSDYLKQKNGQPPKGSMQSCYVSPLGMLNSSEYAGKFTTYVDSGKGNTLDQATYFQKIQTSLDKGFPVIQGVDVYHSSVGTTSTNSHYWVIAGYDTTGSTPSYSITDPATGQTYTENQDFIWKHSTNPAESGQVLFYVP